MKKKLSIGILVLFLLTFIIAMLFYFLEPKYKKYKEDQIVKEHLQEINTCIKDHYNETDDVETLKVQCTEGFLFIYEETRNKIDYNELAEKIKYKYPEYNDLTNDDLVIKMLNNYTSFKKNITGLKVKTFEITAPDGTKFKMKGYTVPTEKEMDKEYEKVKNKK